MIILTDLLKVLDLNMFPHNVMLHPQPNIPARVFFDLMLETSFLDFSLALMRPSLLSNPKTLEAAIVVSLTALSQAYVWQSMLSFGKGWATYWSSCSVGMEQVRTGSISSDSDQSLRL